MNLLVILQSFGQNFLSFVRDNWAAGLTFLGITITELVVWHIKNRKTNKATSDLQKDMQAANRELEDHKAKLKQQDEVVSDALSVQVHVRKLTAEKMVEGTEALCTRAAVLCHMAMPCVTVDMALQPGERHGEQLLRTLGWEEDGEKLRAFRTDLNELLGYDENERWWLFVTPDVRLAYSCLLYYVTRCQLILWHSLTHGVECDFAGDPELKRIAHEWANLGNLEGDLPEGLQTGTVRKTIDTLRQSLLLHATSSLAGNEIGKKALGDFESIKRQSQDIAPADDDINRSASSSPTSTH